MSYDPMAGFFSSYNTAANNRRADTELEQRKIEWAMKNKLADQQWADDQEIRGLAKLRNEEPVYANNPDLAKWDSISGASETGGQFLQDAMAKRAAPTPEQNLAAAPDTSGADYNEYGQPTPERLARGEERPPRGASLADAVMPKPVTGEALMSSGYHTGGKAVAPLTNVVAPPEAVIQTGTRQVPLTMRELGNKQAEVYASKGQWKEAIAATQGPLDVTMAAPKHAQAMAKQFLMRVQQNLAGGDPPDVAKQKALNEMRMLGAPAEAVQGFSAMNVLPGGVLNTLLQNGDSVTHMLDPDGEYKVTYNKKTAVTGQKMMTPEFSETNTIGGKKFETTHQWQFHNTDKYTDGQLFAEWQRLGGTDEAAKQIASRYGGVEKIKKDNQSYATPASVINFDRRNKMIGSDAEGRPVNESPDGHKTVQYPDGTIKPYYGTVYTRGEASSMSGEIDNAGLTPAEKIANKKAAANPQAIQLKAASVMYNKEAPEIKRLRVAAQAEGFIPSTKFKNLEALDQWINDKTGGPETILLKKKVKFLADSLQKAIGGNAGGQWAFKVASDILDPSYDPNTFNAIVDSHGASLQTMADERIQPYKPAAPAADVVPKARPGYKIQWKVVNGKKEYREVPK